MASYCCFINPEKDYAEKKLEDIAPSGFAYGFPLFNCPDYIIDYKVVKPLNRGFYGATYVVEDELQQFKVLKVIPKRIYDFFNKNFKQECILHAQIAKDSDHIVRIITKHDDIDIIFPGIDSIKCHVAVLDYVEGNTLQEILESDEPIESSKIAQIAIDLFRLLNELNNKQANHNDLHAGNLMIKELDERSKRADEINNYYKVVAIDLGSISEESKSDKERLGDIHRVADYLKILSQKLLKEPDKADDNDYKLAYLLDEYAGLMSTKVQNQTLIGYIDAIDAIKNAFLTTYSPWEAPIELKNIGDSYNAQTLQPSFVPELLVDPDNKWANKISNKGPLLITGMRGCGKTMFLKALQFHARAIPINSYEEDSKEKVVERLKNETYVGLYVSSRKLLDKLGKDVTEPLFEPFSRLFIAYALEAIRAIRHLSDINKTFVVPFYYIHIKDVVSQLVNDNHILQDVKSDISLENTLINMLFSLSKGEDKYVISVSPSNAFPFLAEATKKCSTIWRNHYILFLLDDVSTRYFHQKNIADLLSALIFQSEVCAFKITSEAQTLLVILNSPGNISKARLGRDIDSFDLGQEVYDKIKERGRGGINFLEEILSKRAKISSNHPKNQKPSQLLGENNLKNIAKTICNIQSDQSLKKKVYYGITALAGFCVGDIGEVISLYDSMLKYYKGHSPITADGQSGCFRDISSARLFQLNRIESSVNLKDYALSFAEAAHELLLNSHRFTPNRLREYYSIYINITSGSKEEQDQQFNKLIELIDAGVFVFAGGSTSPRITGTATNPIKQFVLIYRKLYGVTNLIGFQQSDRFELSGDKLIEYLNYPKRGKEILMSGLGNRGEEVNDSDKYKYQTLEDESKPVAGLFDEEEVSPNFISREEKDIVEAKTPKVSILQDADFKTVNIDLLILGLGFEHRAFSSILDLLNNTTQIKKVLCIKYEETGQSEKILKLLDEKKIEKQIYYYKEFVDGCFLNDLQNLNVLVNVSGLSKVLIFKIVNTLSLNNRMIFTHTLAERYYPLDTDIEKYLEGCKEDKDYEFLEKITSDLIKGEKGPYHVMGLHDSNADESKKRVLITFSSPKYERLFKIIDEREYDIIELISPVPTNPRTKLAGIAADILSKRFNHVIVKEIDTNNLTELIKYIYEKYYYYYVRNNYNVEFALTGSKRQTIVSSLMCKIFKISKCWYVTPTDWDTERFSEGTKETTYFEFVNPEK